MTLFAYFAAAAVDPAAAATDCKVHHGNGESFESAVSGAVEADTAAAAAAAAAAAVADAAAAAAAASAAGAAAAAAVAAAAAAAAAADAAAAAAAAAGAADAGAAAAPAQSVAAAAAVFVALEPPCVQFVASDRRQPHLYCTGLVLLSTEKHKQLGL